MEVRHVRWRDRRDRHPGRGAVRRGPDGADRPAGAGRGGRAARPLHPHPGPGPHPAAAVRRPDAPDDRPARAGGQLPAPAGHHVGQPDRRRRLGHLLPGHRSAGGDLRDPELHPGRRAADDHHAAQRDRLAQPRAGADQPGRDQQQAAGRARRGHRPVGHPGRPGRDQGDRPAAVHPGRDGAADARRPQQARADPHGRGPARVGDQDRRGAEGGADPRRRGAEAGRDPRRRGRPAVAHPARRG